MNLTGMVRLSIVLAVLAGAVFYLSASMVKTTDFTPKRAVVVELFTSEGCSSCPPADELLGHLRQDLAAKNVQVIPMGFHVDYWNSLGWKDRFSSAEFSRRQEEYTRSLGVDGPYTPQMIVDGTVEFVGSSASQADREIARAASEPAIAEVNVSPNAPDSLSVHVKAPAADSGNVMLAITEDNLTTHVGSGENNGHTLHHAAVVREFRQLGQLHDGSFDSSVPVKLQTGWKRADLHAVVFVQEGPMGKIQGAASVSLASQAR
ncbi:MAG TPA: DUF1223 domain-containing protein [Candidatus Angelobacter sp.]|nr:DUF1223 domain-containing protein [Candidatus Angelobacter sp.]